MSSPAKELRRMQMYGRNTTDEVRHGGLCATYDLKFPTSQANFYLDLAMTYGGRPSSEAHDLLDHTPLAHYRHETRGEGGAIGRRIISWEYRPGLMTTI